MYAALRQEIDRQVQGSKKYSPADVQVRSCEETGWSIGRKRQHLLATATGKFIVFIDDDDWIAADYVELICDRIREHPDIDCIGMRGFITTNGLDRRGWKISVGCGGWYEKDNTYFRTPNHISPVRREIALQVGFPDQSFGEDSSYSMGIFPLLKKESFIDAELYHYRFVSNKIV